MSGASSLTKLDLSVDDNASLPTGWGTALASSPHACKQLTDLTVIDSFAIEHSELLSLRALPLIRLRLGVSQPEPMGIDGPCLRAIGQLNTLRELDLGMCPVVFNTVGAREITRLQALERLSLQGMMDPDANIACINPPIEKSLCMYATLPSLTHLTLIETHVSECAASAFDHHPLLSTLRIERSTTTDEAICALLSSSSLTSLHFPTTNSIHSDTCSSALQRNTRLLDTDLFPSEHHLAGSKYLSRNRRLLHNWQCICVLLASYRANHASVIRHSMLSLLHDVMSFLVSDDWQVVHM
jgi:hypothetical protein